MSNIAMLGFPNYTAQRFVTTGVVDPSHEPAEMKSERLKTDEATERARIITLDPLYSQWGFETSLVPLQLDAIALVNHNLEDGGQVRFVGWNGASPGPLDLATIALPQTITASSNITGVVGNVDEPISAPDGLNIAPTNPALAWSVTIRFFAPTGSINAGADMMSLVVRVRRLFTGAGATAPLNLPILTASLAAPAFPLGYRGVTVSAAGGQVFIFSFKRSDFTSLSDLRATLAFTPGTSASGGQYAVLETVAVYYDQIDAASPTLDSGWLTVDSDSRLQAVAPSQHIHYIPPSPWTNVTGYGIQFRADQSVHDPLLGSTGLLPAAVISRDPLTFVQAGVAPAGRAIIPASGVRKGIGPMAGTPEVQGFSGVTSGGQGYGADAYGYRVSPPVEVIVTRDELRLIQDQIGFRKGRSAPFYVAIEPGVALQYQMFTAYWATLKSISEPRPLGRYKADGSMKFAVEMSFQEKI